MKPVFYAASHCVTPLGFSTADTFRAVQAGDSALRPQWFDFLGDSFCVATLDADRLEDAYAPLATATAYTKLEKMSIVAVTGALAQVDAALTGPDTLLVYCTTKGNIDQLAIAAAGQPVPPGLYLSGLARTVARRFGFANDPLVVSNACISGLQGLLVAQRLLRAGRYRHAVVVGADQVSKFTLSGFHSFNALSRQLCRPFDAARQGINLGEAAAAVVLTTDPALAGPVEVVAGASSNDAHHISAPSRTGEGLYQALVRVQQQAGPERPDFIGAHGTATIYNDEMEAQALHRAALHEVPLHSLKGYFGHTLGASGLLESALGVESLLRDELICSKNYATCGTTLPLRPIVRATRAPLRRFLKTSSGFGGCNAAVLFTKAA
jgi:3-oxoacyl-[acyl-carrier-protein] synthase-1